LGLEVIENSACGANDGRIVIEASGGMGSYQYSIYGIAGPWQFSSTFTNLTSGYYTPAIRNADGTCLSIGNLTQVPGVVEPIIEVTVEQPAACNIANGVITINLEGAFNDWQYSINGGISWEATPLFSGLPVGIYNISARNDTGTCVVQLLNPVVLAAPGALSFENILSITPSSCVNNNGEILLIVAGADAGSYEYSIDDGQTWQSDSLFSHLAAGIYLARARLTGGGCETAQVASIYLIPSFAPVITQVLANAPMECTMPDGSIAISVSNAPQGLLYSINGGAEWDTLPIFTGLGEGVYEVVVWDTLHQCQIAYPTEIIFTTPEAPLVLDVIATDPTSCSLPDGTLQLLMADTMQSYEVSIDGGIYWQIQTLWQQLPPGDYSVQVRNLGGFCEVIYPAMISLETPLLFPSSGLLPDTVLCRGQSVFYDLTEWEFAEIQWSDGQDVFTNQTKVQLTESGYYLVEATTIIGCLYRDTFEITILNEALYADFLLPAAGVVNEPIVAVDISWPVPEQIHWVYNDVRIVTIQSLPTQEILEFTESGIYVIGLEVFVGACYQYLEKEIRIYSTRDSLDQELPNPVEQRIRSFEIYPNPNNGAFQAKLLLTEPATAQIWLFRGDGTLVEHRQVAGSDYYLETYAWTDLPPGVYTALAQSGENWVYVNFVIQ